MIAIFCPLGAGNFDLRVTAGERHSDLPLPSGELVDIDQFTHAVHEQLKLVDRSFFGRQRLSSKEVITEVRECLEIRSQDIGSWETAVRKDCWNDYCNSRPKGREMVVNLGGFPGGHSD